MGVWGGIGLSSFGMGGLQALKPENVKAMKSFVDETKFEELKTTYSDEAFSELQNEMKGSQKNYSDSLYEKSNLFTKDDKGTWTANPDADQEKVKEFESLYKTETGTFGKNIQDYSNMEKQNRVFQKIYAAYQSGKIPAANFLAYAKQFDEAKDINYKVFQENLTQNVIHEDIAGLRKTMASNPQMFRWLINSGGLPDAVFARNNKGEKSFYPYGIEKKNGVDPVHMPTGQLLTMSLNNLIQAVNLNAADFQAIMKTSSARNEEKTPLTVRGEPFKDAARVLSNLITPVRKLESLMAPKPENKHWVGFDKFPTRAKAGAKADGMIGGLSQLGQEIFQQFFTRMPGDTDQERMENLKTLAFDPGKLETLLQDDKSLLNQTAFSEMEYLNAVKETQVDGKDTDKTKEFKDRFEAMFKPMKDKDGSRKYFLDPVSAVGYEMNNISNYTRVTQENGALFQLPDSNKFMSVPGNKDGKIDEENLPKWLNDLSKHLASQGVPDPMNVALTHMQMLKSKNKISTPLADTNPTKSSIGWVQDLFGDRNTQTTSIKIDDDQTVKAIKFKDLSKGGFNISVIETPANAKLNGAVLIDDDSGKFPNVIMNVVKEAGKNVYVRLNSLGEVIAKFYNIEDFKKMFGESTDYFLGALKQLKGEPVLSSGQQIPVTSLYAQAKGGLPLSDPRPDTSISDYNDARAKEAGIVPDETGHSGSVAEANEQEINRYELPPGSYISLKGENHKTLQLSIDAEAKEDVYGGPRRPVQNILDGQIFFIPELEPLPPGMKDFVLPKEPQKNLQLLGNMPGMPIGAPILTMVPGKATPKKQTGIGTATPDVVPGYSSARAAREIAQTTPVETQRPPGKPLTKQQMREVKNNYRTQLTNITGGNEPLVNALLAQIGAETNFNPTGTGDGETAHGPGQHMGSRLESKIRYLIQKYGSQMPAEDKKAIESLYSKMNFWDSLGTEEKKASGKLKEVAAATKSIVDIARRNGLLSDSNEMDFLHYELENNFGRKGGWNTKKDWEQYQRIKRETLENPSLLNQFRLGAVITNFIRPADKFARLKNIQNEMNGGITTKLSAITDEQVKQVAAELGIRR